jgi:hypothetical protein
MDLNDGTSTPAPWYLEVMISLAAVVILYIALGSLNAIYTYMNRLSLNRTTLLPLTYTTNTKTYQIEQNPNLPLARTLAVSDNERSGIEFSYSFFLQVDPSTFRQEQGLLHIFHKGGPGQFPLLGPGVFMNSHTNTLRVYMNTYKTWNNYTEVDNFPINKWVHVALVSHSTHLEVYINGNLKKRMDYGGFLPYQNYQNICAFSQRRISLKASVIPSLNGEDLDVFGVMQGQLSRLIYFNYALSYTEINSLLNQGPSTTLASATQDPMTPYLEDTWWTTRY